MAKLNPAVAIKDLHSGDGFHTWSIPEVRQFEAKHPAGSKARLTLYIAMFTGLRRQEVAILGRQHCRDGWVKITPGKTKKSSGVTVEIPMLPLLRDAIASTPTGDMAFLVTDQGKPFTVNGLGNKFRDWCDAAGLAHCSLHGLRKAGATIAAENGATDDELMAIFAWTTKKQTGLYTRKADRKRLAERAIHKLIPHDEIAVTVPPSKGLKKVGQNARKMQ